MDSKIGFLVANSLVPKDFEVDGCQVSIGKECRGCGGWYKITSANLTRAVLTQTINPEKLCGPLEANVNQAIALLGICYENAIFFSGKGFKE